MVNILAQSSQFFFSFFNPTPPTPKGAESLHNYPHPCARSSILGRLQLGRCERQQLVRINLSQIAVRLGLRLPAPRLMNNPALLPQGKNSARLPTNFSLLSSPFSSVSLSLSLPSHTQTDWFSIVSAFCLNSVSKPNLSELLFQGGKV